MKSKRIISILLATVLISTSAAVLSACGGDNQAQETTAAETAASDTKTSSSPAVDDLMKSGVDVTKYGVDPEITNADDEEYGFQLDKPKKGDKIAIMYTNMGEISLRLFDKYAPKTVDNFIKLAENGKYNHCIFHRVIKDL